MVFVFFLKHLTLEITAFFEKQFFLKKILYNCDFCLRVKEIAIDDYRCGKACGVMQKVAQNHRKVSKAI